VKDLEELVKNVDANNKTELDRATKIADYLHQDKANNSKILGMVQSIIDMHKMHRKSLQDIDEGRRKKQRYKDAISVKWRLE